ncbi:glycoside hydrolase family 99-like domain-containing protein [Stieleria sp. JC731]|uniref:glycoside hydrolase family 71/99-like protein n=1 Tax=Pirellulaceae TaxID=2691357 RepID=UPI001E336AE4|nr:glycoside hydrolase family 71/99-like protein [Stieleria sp. JC731]MCC9601258.1 glycoside hydrolase family 99-like domain-containing protein [Stieleria sp. JC731]
MPFPTGALRTFLRRLTIVVFCWLFIAPNVSCAQSDHQLRKSPSTSVLVHYMPWFKAEPEDGRWGWHWTMNHFDPNVTVQERRQIAANHYPLIGPYDSGDEDVLEFHLLTMKLAGIDGVIVDWYGLSNYRDYAILHRNTTRLLQQCERLKMKFVICYEDQTIPALVDAKKIPPDGAVDHASEEINWLSQYWFKSGAYVKLDGKPVLLSFGHSGLTDDQWKACLDRLKSPVLYFSQDYRRDGAAGAFGWPAPKVGLSQVDRFISESKSWERSIPVAFPRFNDIYKKAGINEGYPVLPDNKGQTFKSTFTKAIGSKAAIVQIATWNDWGEGTQIEPSVEFGYRDLNFIRSVCVPSPNSSPPDELELLRIPLRLYELRRSTSRDSLQPALDELVTKIIAGDTPFVLKRLEELEKLTPRP